MSDNWDYNYEEPQYKSLIFNAGNINDANTTGPDTEQLGGSGLFILGWLIPVGDTDEYSLTFSVPKDAVRRCQNAKVFVHLISDNTNTPGDRFSIRFSSLFTRANGVIDIDDLNTVNRNNIPVKNSPGSQQYNHYVLEFKLEDIIRAEDFALLSIARIPATNDFQGAVALTSIEFRYLGC
ncbi:hypothetical protein [Terrisporobacter mayombei]|uniref:Uncharacterized protein n=1 Tax=Terrisporobacter mayombei TaxID=1541 RepID=A0ABY9Q7B8_9FIRM|nr:hypothetical protein [Terrisporobacter mayombei]MCC3868906.1 hypothetical protein [Terrisporobacter mayombei]WMT82960.1 hypothetical protein TEMA_34580 [Terrisporobacter mayombei]